MSTTTAPEGTYWRSQIPNYNGLAAVAVTLVSGAKLEFSCPPAQAKAVVEAVRQTLAAFDVKRDDTGNITGIGRGEITFTIDEVGEHSTSTVEYVISAPMIAAVAVATTQNNVT